MTVTIDGTNGISIGGAAPVIPNGALTGSALTLGTPQTTTSGTSFTFTGIPSWAKRVTLMFYGTALSGSANLLVQIGSGSVTTSGYTSTTGYGGYTSGITSPAVSTAGFVCQYGGSTNSLTGTMVINLFNNYNYVSNHTLGMLNGGVNSYFTAGGGVVSLSGAMDRVKITTTNGTDTFTNGLLNISYE